MFSILKAVCRMEFEIMIYLGHCVFFQLLSILYFVFVYLQIRKIILGLMVNKIGVERSFGFGMF